MRYASKTESSRCLPRLIQTGIFAVVWGIVLLLGIVGCGSDDLADPISVSWQFGVGLACDDPAVTATHVSVLLSSTSGGDEIERTVPCQDSPLVIEGVEAGGYTLSVVAGQGEAFSMAQFEGLDKPVFEFASATGDVNEIGPIALRQRALAESPTQLRLEWDFAQGLCGANDVENVEVIVWKDQGLNFVESRMYPCSLPQSEGYIEISLVPNIDGESYAISVNGFNARGKQTKVGTARKVVVTDGQVTDLRGDRAIILNDI